MVIGFNVSGLIEETLIKWIQSLIQDILQFINQFVFNYDGVAGYALEIYNLFVWLGGLLMVTLALGKVILQIISEGEGSQEASVYWVLVQAVKGSSLIFIMPIIISFIMNNLVMPIGTYIIDNIGEISTTLVNDMIDPNSEYFVEVFNGTISIIVFGIFITFVFIFFIFKMVLTQANILLNEILTPLVAISVMTENYNFVENWWRDLIMHSLTIIVLAISLLLFIESISLNQGEPFKQLPLIIGSGAMVITGPTLVKSIWYKSGLGRTGSSVARSVMMGMRR